MKVLENLEPKRVFHFFEEMSVIPRGSGNTRAVSDWCADFARARGLEYHQDSDNNIIIIKEATPGYEQAEPMILQGHLDMVCEKEPDCSKDMAKEGLDLEVDGDFVSARGTTLGGDDGIAVAMALWPSWIPMICPTPGWKRSSRWTRRLACWVRARWM
ncbi:hypothetical protein [uncultured Subdoligranulum sp.]|uniref:hypothetical protein n=1 Tax=uncultured Subdoligranulum sp. TaxID=512298 RepID=UPI00320A20C4